jgi:quercetin dioxygenase-like cupin family protein
MKAKEYKNSTVVYGRDVEPIAAAEGVTRRILAYTDGLMCVENVFEKGAVGSIHTHPHTQLTYVVSGKFRFTVGDEEYLVTAGDTLLKQNGIVHGCVAEEGGVLLDIFTPMREDVVK